MSGKIDHQLFEAHEQALEHEPCPKCGGELTLRHSKNGPFLGCSLYPKCEYIKPLHQNDGHVVKALGLACPDCQNELVLRQGRYGMFIGCSGYPECHHIESLDQKNEDEEALDNCLCPECVVGYLVERKSRFGKIFFACDNFPKCKFAVNQQPVNGKCENCGYPLLVEKKAEKEGVYQCANRKCQHTQEK